VPGPSRRASGCYDHMMRLALDPFRLVLISLAGWFNQQQQAVIEYLQEENRVLREQLGGKRLRFNDAQRRRLAVRAKKLGWRMLHELTTNRDAGNAPVSDPRPRRQVQRRSGDDAGIHRQ